MKAESAFFYWEHLKLSSKLTHVGQCQNSGCCCNRPCVCSNSVSVVLSICSVLRSFTINLFAEICPSCVSAKAQHFFCSKTVATPEKGRSPTGKHCSDPAYSVQRKF